MFDVYPLYLSLQLALVTTIILLLLCIPLAYRLAQSQSKLKFIIEALIALPIVLPSTVLGFYFLLVFSPQSFVGAFLHNTFSVQLIFSFEGLVLASCVYSFPFMFQPIQAAFEQLPKSFTEAAQTMGKNNWQILKDILLPCIRPSLSTAIVLTFAHTIGEFGIVLMIGGKIPGETKVASIALYDEVEQLNYEAAHQYALILLCTSFVVLTVLYALKKKNTK